ncbi:MAG: GtrA family protein, partial [Clostridia bacterium]|nr:GtrA family protein [Clostridia bacterium]
MKKWLRGKRDFWGFVICGGLGTVANFIASALFSQFLEPTLAYVLGYALSLSVTYYLNAKLVFKRKLTWASWFKFIISYIPNFVILFSLVCFFIHGLHWPNLLVYALAAAFGLPIAFV